MDPDPAAEPWCYPGRPARCSGLLDGDRFVPRASSELLRLAGDRSPVVAVGSNGSPTVLHRKLAGHGVAGVVPLIAGTLTGCAVGHSAHVSAPGFVAAAPYRAGDAVTPVVVSLLDERQVACLDRTEPNYVRRRRSPGDCALDLEGGIRPALFDLYDSQWGVLAAPGRSPLPFVSQEDLHAYLRGHWPAYHGLLGSGTARHAMHRLAADVDLRTRVREALAATGWARPSGLE
jgi:hypothetical protein